jgi:hypothetical protein
MFVNLTSCRVTAIEVSVDIPIRETNDLTGQATRSERGQASQMPAPLTEVP